MSKEASAAGRALVGHRWAKASEAEKLKVGRELTAKRLKKQKKKKGETDAGTSS